MADQEGLSEILQKTAAKEPTQSRASPPPPPPPEWLKTWKRRGQGQPWGFVAFYDADQPSIKGSAMEEFKAQVLKIAGLAFDIALEQGQPGDEIAEARNKFEIRWIEATDVKKGENEKAQDQVDVATDPADKLRAQYQAIRTSGDLPGGLSMPVFFYATTEAINSVLTTLPSGIDSGGSKLGVTNRYWRSGAPFLVAIHEVDALALDEAEGVNPEEEVGGAGENGWYKPIFKVSLETLVEELWWILTEQITDFWKITRFVRRADLGKKATPEDDGGGEEEAGENRPAGAHDERREPGQDKESAVGEDGLLDLWWTVHMPPQLLRKRRW